MLPAVDLKPDTWWQQWCTCASQAVGRPSAAHLWRWLITLVGLVRVGSTGDNWVTTTALSLSLSLAAFSLDSSSLYAGDTAGPSPWQRRANL